MWVLRLAGWMSIIPLTILAAKGGDLVGMSLELDSGYGSLVGAMAGLVIGFWLNYLVDERTERRRKHGGHGQSGTVTSHGSRP